METPSPAAPAAVPSTPAPSTPAVSTPSAPVSAPSTPASTPAAPQTPGAEIPKPERPKRETYGDDISAYLRDEFKYDREHGDEEVETEAASDEPAQDPPAEAQAEAPAEIPAEAAPAAEPEESLTPESLARLEGETPELKALLEAHPSIKGQFYKMARENAKLSALGELYPHENVQQAIAHATFDKEVASRTTSIKGAFLAAEQDPSQITGAIDLFLDEFREVDDKGQPILDAQGNPVFGKDLDMMVGTLTDRRLDGSIQVAEQKLASGELTERQKFKYEAYVDALKFIRDFDGKSEQELDRPDVDHLDPETRSYFDKRDEELKKREEEVGLRQKQEDAKAKSEARQASEAKINAAVGQGYGERLEKIVKAEIGGNVHFPMFAIQDKDPVTGRAYFADRISRQFMLDTIGYDVAGRRMVPGKGIAALKADFARLEGLPPSAETEAARIAFFHQAMDDHLPRIAKGELRRIQKGYSSETSAQQRKEDQARAAVTPEPRSSSAPRPQNVSDEELMKQAKQNVAKQYEGQYLEGGERIDKQIREFDRLSRQVRR